MRISPFILFLICLATMTVVSCTKDKRPPIVVDCDDIPPVWNGEVKEIIDLTCAYVGCHIGGGNGVPGNYTSYGGISTALANEDFKIRTLDIRDMPPSYASGAKVLTDEQLNILTCWMEAGFPEN